MACVPLLEVDGIQLELAVAGAKAQQVGQWLSSSKGTLARRQLQKILLDVVSEAEASLPASAPGCADKSSSEAEGSAFADNFQWVGEESESVAGEVIKPPKKTESPRPRSVPGFGASGEVPSDSGDQERRDPAEPTKAKYGISLERRMRAYTAGVEAGKKLRGAVARVAPTPELQMQKEFYVVLRGLHAEEGVYKRWFRNRHGAGAEEVVCEDTDDGRTQGPATVHHGFPSGTEVADYCAGAGVAVPQQMP